jgi:Tol biopolymer transport system component
MSVSTTKTAQFALSPDGRTLAFVAGAHGSPQLWVREMDQNEPRSLPDTAGASYPFWSPDSRFVGFFANGTLRKIRLTARHSQKLCDAPNGRGGAWHDQTIVFSPNNWGGLSVVSANGGPPKPFTSSATDTSHRWPQFLPNGRVLFFVRSPNQEVEGIYDASLERPYEIRQLRPNDSGGVYSSEMLLYVLDGALVAQALDARSGMLTGEAIPLGQKASVSSARNPAVSASSEGTLATWGNVGGLSELVWFNRNGDRVGTAGPADRYVDFRLSPDDRRLAVARIDAVTNTADLDVLDLDRGDFTSLSSTPQTDATPIWSPDGQRLVFRSNRRSSHDLFERPSNGSGSDSLLYTTGFGMYPTDWSRHDGTILFHHLGKSTKHDIMRFNPQNQHAEPVQQTAADEVHGQLAPGGRLAYTSDETGGFNVYVRTLAVSSGPTKVSVDGGFDPRWSADGRTLFFVDLKGMLTSAEMTNTDPPQVMTLKPLFNAHIPPAVAPYLSSYAVTRDGTRFLINVPTDQPGNVPITLTLNWRSLIHSAR